jgi:hypothetical protein
VPSTRVLAESHATRKLHPPVLAPAHGPHWKNTNSREQPLPQGNMNGLPPPLWNHPASRCRIAALSESGKAEQMGCYIGCSNARFNMSSPSRCADKSTLAFRRGRWRRTWLRPHLGHTMGRIPCYTVMLSVRKDKASQHRAIFRFGSGPRCREFKSPRPDQPTYYAILAVIQILTILA